MIRPSRVVWHDTFRAAKTDLGEVLRRSGCDREALRRGIRRFLDVGHRLRGLGAAQRQSAVNSGLTVLFLEARKRRHTLLAEVALTVALEEQVTLDPIWVTDALGTCRSDTELLAISAALRDAPPGTVPPRLMPLLENPVAPARGADDQPELGNHAPAAGGKTEVVTVSEGSVARRARAVQRAIQRGRDGLIAPPTSFQRYFLRQGIVGEERELRLLVDAMRQRPPICFRVHRSHMLGAAVNEILSRLPGIRPLTWLPPASVAFVLEEHGSPTAAAGEAGYFHHVDRSRALLKALGQERLVSFQSESSMLPAHLLAPQRSDTILDLCASPGSKTMQLIDLTMENLAAPPAGAIVANEALHSRAPPLLHRVANQFPSVAVTRINGTRFPRTASEAGGLLFDRVLVDAPCSSEGRMNRDHLSWRLWHPLKAMEFYPTQVALLRQALSLTKEGGTVVYATCTLNPIENEAVLATVLADGKAELVPLPRLQGITMSRGLRAWLVPGKAGNLYSTPDDSQCAGIDDSLPPGLFSATADSEHLRDIERCAARVLPHLNGGMEGFFVAILRRRRLAQRHAMVPGFSDSNVDERVAQPSETPFREPILRSAPLSPLSVSSPQFEGQLGVFFGRSAQTAIAALEHRGMCLVWRRNAGITVVSQSLFAVLSGIDSQHASLPLMGPDTVGEHPNQSRATKPPPTNGAFIGAEGGSSKSHDTIVAPLSPELMSCGVAVTEGSEGRLTEAGASLLLTMATSHVFEIPLSAFQMLLSTRELSLSPSMVDVQEAALRKVSNEGGSRSESTLCREPQCPRWVARCLAAFLQDGNGVATVPYGDLLSSASPGGCAASRLCVPVAVQRSGPQSLELKLLLAPSSRSRIISILGRLRASNALGGADRERRVLLHTAEVNRSVRNAANTSTEDVASRGLAALAGPRIKPLSSQKDRAKSGPALPHTAASSVAASVAAARAGSTPEASTLSSRTTTFVI